MGMSVTRTQAFFFCSIGKMYILNDFFDVDL